MNDTKTTEPVATPDADAAAQIYQSVLERQRKRISRTLLKRRRQKAGQ